MLHLLFKSDLFTTNCGKKKEYSEEEIIINELKNTQTELIAAYSTFQQVTEPELIDSAIFELESIKKRYSFLYRKINEFNSFKI